MNSLSYSQSWDRQGVERVRQVRAERQVDIFCLESADLVGQVVYD